MEKNNCNQIPPLRRMEKTTELMGAEILVKALQAENVKYIWGYPGGSVLYIYDALYKQDTMQHVLGSP
jgi:acetolactate synthase-1/2/3 large subunit